jgi:purine-binding chemotaxis protein CheW
MSDGCDAYILFMVAGTTYALRSDEVRHMEMVEQITPVPQAHEYLEGVAFSRGQIVPVLSLRARFGFERIPFDLQTRLLVVQATGRWVSLVVDSAREFMRIPASAIQPPPTAISAPSGNCVQSVANLGGRLVLILDVARVLEPAMAEQTTDGAAHPPGRPDASVDRRRLASGDQVRNAEAPAPEATQV